MDCYGISKVEVAHWVENKRFIRLRMRNVLRILRSE